MRFLRGKKKVFSGRETLIEDKTTDPLFMKVGANYYFYHTDHLGTPQKMTAVNGAVVWSAKHSSFGEADVDAASTVTNPLRFPGQYFDAETGLYYNYFRYYNAMISRYNRSDPAGIFVGNNISKLNHLYLYANSNPLMFKDPLGLGAISCFFKGTVALLKCGSNKSKALDLYIENANRVEKEYWWCKWDRYFCKNKELRDKKNSEIDCKFYWDNYASAYTARLDSVNHLPDHIKQKIQKYGNECYNAITKFAVGCAGSFL